MEAASSYSCTPANYVYKEGCSIIVQCKTNFYFMDKTSGRNGQKVFCRGGQWKKEDGSAPETRCRGGCIGLREDLEMKNATYVSVQPPSDYYNGDLVMWKKGTVVKTKCKEGYLFRHKYNQEDGQDNYQCAGGNEGWTDNKDPNERTKTGMGKAPGLCNPLCPPIDKRDIPEGVKITFDPLGNPNLYKLDSKGNKLLVPSATYNFACAEGYKYPDGKTMQKLLCKGGGEGFEDADSNKRNAQIKTCISNGCPPISSSNVDPSAQIERSNCDAGVKEGCTVTIKCKKPTHYFSNPLLANGYTLKCNAKGEWVDQQGQPVKPNSKGSFTDQCLGGCPVPSSTDMANAEYSVPAPTGSSAIFNNGDQQIYGGTVRVTTRCKNGFGRPNEKDRKADPITFTCDANSNGWTNTATGDRGSPSTCQSGCKLSNAPEGTKYSNLPEGNLFMSGGQQYATLGSRVVVQCNTDYEDPKTKSPSTTQSLVCKGDNAGGWVDESTQGSTQPMVCQKSGAKGCEPASLNNADVTKDNCDIQEGLMPENCKLTIKCKEGYIPSDPSAVDGTGEQSLVCVAKNDGWKDSKTGKTKIAPVKCVPVCNLLDPMEKANYAKKPSDSDLVTYNGKKYAKQGTTVTIQCKDPFVGKHDKDREGDPPKPIEYLCRGGVDGWFKPVTLEVNRIPGDSCGSLCDPLPPPPVGTMQFLNPRVFEYKGEPKVVEEGFYKFKCANGYKYPDGTPEAVNTQQILVCKGGDKGYVNQQKDGKDNVALIPCVRGSTPGCSKVDVDSPPTGINVTQSAGCSLSNDKSSVGCTLSMECANGYYPSKKTTTTQPKQSLKCVDNGTSSSWIDTQNNAQVDILQCEPGCPSLGVSKNSILVTGNNPSLETASGQFYAVGSRVTVQCAAGSVHRTGKADNPSESMEYVCRGGSDSPWSNLKYPGMEKVPGDGCLRTCIAPQFPPGMRSSESPATTTMGDNVVVKGGDRYKLKCMDGYHYPAGSPYEKNNEQIIVCDNDSGKLKDVTNGGQLVDGPAKCIKTTGEGCADMVQKNAKIVNEVCPAGKKNAADCKITVQCNEGFIPSDPAYHPTGKQILVCENGYNWVDTINKKNITSGLECKEACRVDAPATNPSSEVTKKSGKEVTVDKFIYVVAGELITVTCKGDEVVWDTDSTKTPNPHDYTCAGGTLGWKRNEDNTFVASLGDGCVKTCPPLSPDLIPSTVRQHGGPKVIEYNGKQYVAEGQSYVFKCSSDKDQYPPSSPNAGPQQETFKCDGSKRSYINPNTGKGMDKPETCTRKSGLDECKRVLQNTSVTIATTGAQCKNDGDFYPTGCTISIKCKQGYYPSDKKYLNPTGEQTITCGSGGTGWKDQFNKKIGESLNCVQGCVNASASTSNSDTSTLREVFTSSGGLVAVCESKNKTTTVIGVLPDHPYYCPVDNKNDTSYYDKECTNACRELARPLPVGVTIFKNPEFLPTKPYSFGGQQYVLKCSAGYVYPKGSKQRDQGRQTLECDGATNKYNDVDDSSKGVSPMACEEAKGCAEIKQPKEAEVTKSGCSFNDPYYNDKCELTINCQNGYYPNDVDAVVNQGKKIVCDEEKDTWVTSPDGAPIKTSLECVQGCKEINLKEVIEWNNSTERVKEITNHLLDGQFYPCIAGSLLEKSIGQIRKALQDQNRYYCKRTELKIEDIVNLIVDDTVCKNSCPFKTFTLPTGVVLKTSPKFFEHDNVKMAPKDGAFVFECQGGFQYNPKSPYAADKKQTLTCTGNGSYFDTTTKTLNPNVSPCEKILGCTPPPPTEGVKQVRDPSCVVSAGIAVPPCKFTLECEEGYYPLLEDYQKKPNQSIVCTPGVAAGTWNDVTSKKSTSALTCAKGCMPKPKLGSETSTTKDTTVEKYMIPQAGEVVCIATTINSSTVDNYKDVNLPFYCPTNESSSMTNFTNTPCSNVCSNLTIASTLSAKPPTLYIKGLIPNLYTWMISCPEGKVFADTASRSRELQCDGATKTYTDLSTGKTMIINVDDTCIAPATTTSTTTTTTTTTKPPTTTTKTTTTPTTTTTTTTAAPTTPTPCAAPPSTGVDFKKGTAGQTVPDGQSVEIACKPGSSPTDPSLYLKPSQTLKCSGGKLVDASDPSNTNPKVLSCTEGCVQRKYEVTETSSDGSSTSSKITIPHAGVQVEVKCSASKITTSATRKLIGESHQFLCDDNLGSTVKFDNGTFSPCTNACMAPLPGDSGVSNTLAVKRNGNIPKFAAMMKIEVNGATYQFVFDKDTLEVSCAVAGEKFSNDPSASSLTMVCDAKTGQFSDSVTGKPLYPSNSLPTCGNTPNPPSSNACPSLSSTASYTVRKQSCGDSFDGEKAGCKVYLVCTTNPDIVKSSWECQSNKQWKNIKDGSSVATLSAPSC